MRGLKIKDKVLVKCRKWAKSVTVPKEVYKIESYAFLDCTRLKEICVSRKNVFYTSVDGVLFTRDMKTLVAYPPKKAGEEYVIPEGVEVVGEDAFAHCKLKRIVLPTTIKEIEGFALFDCLQLEELVIPEGVREIDGSFMHVCMDKLVVPSTLEKIDESIFAISRVKKIDVNSENKHFKFENGCLYDYDKKTLIRCFNDEILTADEVLEGVEEICPWAFQGALSLTEVRVPEAVEKVACGVFYNCKRLRRVRLHDGVKVIEHSAFAYSGIEKIELPSSLERIEWFAFSDCKNLKSLFVPDNVELGGDITRDGNTVIYCKESDKMKKAVKKYRIEKVEYIKKENDDDCK